MNAGLLRKSVREVGPPTAVATIAAFLVVAVLAYVLPTFQDELIGKLWDIGFVRTVVRAALGAEVGDHFGPETALAFAWSHPVVIAIFVAHAIVVCSRVPAGEVDRGTIDLLLGLPVTRGQVFRIEGAVFVGSALVVAVGALAGHGIGTAVSGVEPPPIGWRRLPIVCNLVMLELCFGAITAWIAACCDARGRAVTLALGVVIPAFLANFLRQFWTPADVASFVSPLRYYQPFATMRFGGFPWGDFAVLGAAALVAWLAAGLTFARRDLCTA